MIAARASHADLWRESACALAHCDADGSIRAANARLAQWCGRTTEQLAGTSFTSLLTRGSALFFAMQLRPRLALGQRIDGALLTLRSASGADGGSAVSLIEQLQATAPVLAVMHGNLELLAHDLGGLVPAQHDARDDLHAAQQAAQRASTIVAQRLAFSGRRPASPDTRHDVDVNTVLNARDAVKASGHAGTITIGSECVTLDRHPGEAGPASHVRFFVEDTGCGMSDDVRRRAFEPFFTTKPAGSGTGLGLSTVFGLVRAHGGEVEIESEPSRGTRVLVTLPVGTGAA
jgi:signal transduction histidine kinase